MRLINTQRTSTRSRWMTILSLMVCASLVGCTGRPKVGHSGFLGDYSEFKKDPELEDSMQWRSLNKSLKDYDKFIIDPIIIHFAPDAEGTAINPDEVKELTDHFRNQAIEALNESPHYQVVDTPGPGVLRMRVAITGIEKTTPLMNIHPGMKLMGGGLGGAAMEAEGIDSVTGERVIAVVDARSGGRLGMTAGWKTYGHVKQVMDNWVKRFVKRLDKAHGYATE